MLFLYKTKKTGFTPRPFLDKKKARCYDTVYS